MTGRLYLDTAAAAPVRREALEAAWPYLAGAFGNPSSHHEFGRGPADALTDARARVAKVLGMRATDITFTSGGTEADNLAIIGMALGHQTQGRAQTQRRAGTAVPPRRHIVTSPIEHEAVLASVEFLARVHGFTVTEVAPTSDGTMTEQALAAAVRPDTVLVTVGYANNEIGTVADIPSLAGIAHDAGALFHTDAVQAAGWLPLTGLGVDALSLAGHKVGAPKGIGVAAIRARVPVEPLIHGGGQESGRRSGTENVALAVAFATALELAEAERREAADRVRAVRDEFIAAVVDSVPGAFLTGAAGTAGSDGRETRTPNHASFCFSHTSGEAVLLELERRGVTASSGSACAVGSDEPSHVLTALGIAAEVAQTSVRFTFPSSITGEQGRAAAQSVIAAAGSLATSFA
ncbi:cysteine desulfurase family protein [Brevibacterium linens]|uniref:cysteine desulfurase n=1 Tax=Brevibacterium linens ATCC 9172 TaxID=1255617 RepID=A0A2H1IHT6_BRELN|nr:cysteine desulfurase family protein [Brevibacterium linens]KAB1948467.1 cysteine desulfurase [Brevibacterium linens ATCC 9172]SMX74734.1 cysteine desulfurase [Brevibacterium linens ATCC 9172]